MTVDIAQHLAERARAQAISRRQLLARAAKGGMGLAIGPALLAGCGGGEEEQAATAAKALESLRAYGITTFQLEDWSEFSKQTGIPEVAWTDSPLDINAITQEVQVNNLGDRQDLLIFDGSTQGNWAHVLGDSLLPIDTAKLENWDAVPAHIKDSPNGNGPDGKLYGVPIALNADSFTYYTDVIDDEEPVSWSVLFDDERTRGKVALYDLAQVSMGQAAAYLKVNNLATIEDPAKMTDNEVKQVADFLVERKKAGQFRAFWATYDESVQLLSSRDVVAATAWEPTVAQLTAEGKKVKYATTKEGYFKWIEYAWIFRQVEERGTLDAVYKALNYFLGPHYALEVAKLRGYASPVADLAVDLARESEAGEKDVAVVEASVTKVDEKFKAPHFWENLNPDNMGVWQDEWSRFKEA